MPRPTPTTPHGSAYGAHHQHTRQQWAPHVATGQVPCARCGQTIRPGQLWDLGHLDGTGKHAYSGPEHRRCNRSAGSAKGKTNRATMRRKPEPHPGLID